MSLMREDHVRSKSTHDAIMNITTAVGIRVALLDAGVMVGLAQCRLSIRPPGRPKSRRTVAARKLTAPYLHRSDLRGIHRMTLRHSPWRTIGKSRSTEKGVLHTILVPVDRSELSEGTSWGPPLLCALLN